jgi:DNA-binding PadR family transcriptional regulator
MEAKMFQRHRFGPWFGPRGERIFNKGDFKYLILELLKDKPRHGYEIIKDLEEKFYGFYSPSPGSVYPTLQWLEEMGYVTSMQQDGKKIYTITEEGKRFMDEKQKETEDIKNQMKNWWGCWGPEIHQGWHELWRDWGELGRMFAHDARRADAEKMRRIKEVIAKVRQDIEEILRS